MVYYLAMEYVKGTPYFCQRKTKIKSYPYVEQDSHCEILLIGGGTSGAILNYYLSQEYDVMLIEQDRFGRSCTSCATALLEYQLDDFAADLTKYMSKEEILAVYQMGLDGIAKLEKLVNKLGNHCHFQRRPTLLYTDGAREKEIEKEYAFRVDNGFDCELIEEDNNPFPFFMKKGIYCQDGGAEVDPYLLTKELIEQATNQDHIFENTKIVSLTKYDKGWIATTRYGEKIHCQKVILCTGFNLELLECNTLFERSVTYSIVTNPFPTCTWKEDTLIQDVLDPYHYMRKLPDGRIIIGGEDTPWKEEIEEKLAHKKYQKLLEYFLTLFPDMADTVKIEYEFCGCFGSTDNNLGLIGASEQPSLYYFFSCGANGIINAVYAVDIIKNLLRGRQHTLAKVFSPLRKK